MFNRRQFTQAVSGASALSLTPFAARSVPNAGSAQPTVKIGTGRVRGATRAGVHRFLGMPYAQPPVGDLRWAPPQPPVSWKGVRKAVAFSDAALQAFQTGGDNGAPGESEDCLYLNVWSTTLDPTARQPVMLWIHGGGNLYGAASEPMYDGEALAKRGVTLVSFNYRLGAFGFLSHPSFGGNFAVLDYIAALRWVRENIEQFGGDPGNVTIFGQSAGAVAVRTLLASPPAAGLFHRAIIQSAGFEAAAGAEWWSQERNESAANELFGLLGSDDPAVLRAKSASEVLEASRALSGAKDTPGYVRTPAQLVWMPVVDGVTVVGDSYAAWGKDLPVMLGTVENESRFFLRPERTYDRGLLERMTTALTGSAAPAVLQWFDAKGLAAYEALDALVTTVIFTEPASETLAKFARLDRAVYFYHFTRVSPGAERTRMRAAHAAELRYVFGTLTNDDYYDATDRAIANGLQAAWTSFARRGVPDAGTGVWPQYTVADPKLTVIGNNIAPAQYAPSELAQIIKGARKSRPQLTWLGSPQP